MVSHFSSQVGSELVKPTRPKVLGGAGIRDLHNGGAVEFFTNGEVIHGHVFCLMYRCCGKFLMEAHSVGDSSSRGVMGHCAIRFHVTSYMCNKLDDSIGIL